MNKPTLQEQIEMKRNPEAYVLRKVLEIEKDAEEKINKIADLAQKKIEDANKLALEAAEKLAQSKSEIAEEVYNNMPVPEDGETPTQDELLALIEPLIPEIEDGHTPTEDELLSLIRPLIPEKITNAELMVMIDALMPEIGDKLEETGDEIAVKLNKTKGSVEQYVIKGLKKTLEGFSRSIQNIVRSSRVSTAGKSGGGMGNWLHQNTATTSATTTVTISTKVAANGYAMLVRYNGKLLAHNVDYTLNNTTHVITFVGFTLEDDTFVDVTWVRA